MNDILPGEIERWQTLEAAFRTHAERHRFREVRTPMVEPTSLFVRSIGEVTDIVEKEMFSFTQHQESITLRPEGTAGAARAFVEHSVFAQEPISRWYYVGPMFRAERPQRGRYRQFYQAGCEIYGDKGPLCDAEMIDMVVELLRSLGIEDATVHLNSMGDGETRTRFRDALVSHLTPRQGSLSEDSQRRFSTNPLRILDSKDPRDIEATLGAPSLLDVLGDEDRAHFDSLRRTLDRLKTPYQIDARLVRGLDYYTRTLFEVRSNSGELGAQNTLCGGGRYDHMIEGLGGPSVPAIGFAMGLERILLAMRDVPLVPTASTFLAPLGENAANEALLLARELRARGLTVEVDGRQGSLKSKLRRANSTGATTCIILGDSELAEGKVQLKDLQSHQQEDVARADIVEHMARRAPPASGGA